MKRRFDRRKSKVHSFYFFPCSAYLLVSVVGVLLKCWLAHATCGSRVMPYSFTFFTRGCLALWLISLLDFRLHIPTRICLLDTSSFVSSFLTFRYLITTWAGRACTARWIRHHEFHGLPVKLIDTPKCDCIALWVFFLFPRWYSLYFFFLREKNIKEKIKQKSLVQRERDIINKSTNPKNKKKEFFFCLSLHGNRVVG